MANGAVERGGEGGELTENEMDLEFGRIGPIVEEGSNDEC